ncbi:MAG: WYL domain-containing protein [Clostridiales bacterium]|nr:WYL domain-containing protein [Clostridiales bacterium]
MDSKNKLRQVFVLKILYEHTDENHCITIAQILQFLKDEYGIESYRKTIKEDIDLLMTAGFDIEFIKSSQNLYHIVSREFDIAELKVLIDAVVSSKFISKTKSQQLAEKLSKLAGPYMSKELVRNIDVERRVKGDNKQLLLIIDTINTAINQKRKIAFKYFTYNVRKEKKEKHNGYIYKFSPYKLVWNGDYYYVVGFSDKYNDIGSFRVDRITKNPEILDEETVPVPENFDINKYLNTMFRMYNSECKEVELICDNDVIDSIIDRFGEDVQIYANDMESFRIIVNTAVNHIFFSWVFGFGGKVKIKAPSKVKEDYANMVRQAVNCLEQ